MSFKEVYTSVSIGRCIEKGKRSTITARRPVIHPSDKYVYPRLNISMLGRLLELNDAR
jgi:hypothetical protein